MHESEARSVAAEPIIVVRNLSKAFPGVQALKDVQFDLYPGEVHTLVGENGAGKSTLMKILSGVYQRDSGEILVGGKPVEIHNPRAAQRLGISIIHQELNLMNHLTAAQNIFIGKEPRRAGGILLDEKAINAKAKELFDMLHVDLDPRVKVGELTIAKQQMVEIVKALSFDARVLIMDEPTSPLNEAEVEELFEIIRHLRAQGVGIVYISHRMDELFRISDRITVLRDGQYMGTFRASETNLDQIISLMVGRKIDETARRVPKKEPGEVVLEVRNLNRGRFIKNVSFTVRRGEILGFAGLMGAGRTEVARAVFGADPIDSGEIYIKGKKVVIRHPGDAAKHGIGYLSEDRKRYGLAVGMSVIDNICMSDLPTFITSLGVLKPKKMQKSASEQVEALSIKTPSLVQKVKFLSGGNQQKVVIAKWLVKNCDVLFFDEPTRGIDVGAKQEIYQLLNELASLGKAIVMISSELPEILRMSDRIVVMCEGRITGELEGSTATEEAVMKLATQRETMMKTA
ncbi:MAG TPA: D-xylose ABC transporter ATP-binding protein [Spirochaetaceae bacterium]|nr:D-xylose ABC transporter ATP-binding protein [Spirochaetaceae bacterium]